MPCSSLNFTAQLLLLDPPTATYSARYRELSVQSTPQNWIVFAYNANSTLNCLVQAGLGGNFTVRYSYTNGADQVDYASFTLLVKQGPQVSFSSIPQLYGVNQSGVVNISITNNDYNTIHWNTYGGLTVNGTSNHTGILTNATVNTSNWGGRLNVSAVNSCGTGIINSTVIGTPYISEKLLNGSPPQSFNYVNSDAQLLVMTNSTATNCTWEIDGGNGSIYPNSFSCYAVPNNFIRVRAQVSNQYGNGESYIFYITKQNYTGYSMIYPNPTNESINIEFDNRETAEHLLQGIILYDEKSKEIKRYDIEEAKSKKRFQYSTQASLNVRDLSKGIYYLHIFMGSKVFKERIIVN